MDQAPPSPAARLAATIPHPGRLLAGAVLVAMNLACVGLLWWPDPAAISIPGLLAGAAELIAASVLISILWPGGCLPLPWRIPPACLAMVLFWAAMRAWAKDPDSASAPEVWGALILACALWPTLAATACWACRHPSGRRHGPEPEEIPDDT